MKCIVFDADGMTIISEIWSAQYARRAGITEDNLRPFFAGPFQECLIGTKDLKEEVRPYLEGWGWEGGVDEFLEMWFSSQDALDPGMVERIRALRSREVMCVLATNNEKHRTAYFAKRLGFEALFDRIFSSAHIGHKKPHKEFYAHVRAALGDMEIMFWDDDLRNVEGARAAGLNAHRYVGLKDFEEKVDRFLSHHS